MNRKLHYNNTIMCEFCHGPDLHKINFIQPNGTYGQRSASAGCTDCHLITMQNFSSAPIIPLLKHSSHPNNTRNGSLSNTAWCADCHLNGSNPNYRGNKWSPAPPLITVNNTGKAAWINHSTFLTGRIPVNLHAPNLFTDQRNWADCVKCHDASWKLGIAGMDAISTQLGKHSGLNRNAASKTILSDNIDRACWACHTGGEEPMTHPPANIKVRICSSCHTYQEKPFYDAKYVGDEPHGLEPNCEYCHYWGSHNVVRFQVIPGIKAASLSPEKPGKGEKVILAASAHAGYRMSIKAAEYFIDTIGKSGNGMPFEPVDGVFDSQKEDMIAEINTTGINVGEHVINIHAMERDNRWGAYYPVNLTIVEMSYSSGILKNLRTSMNSEWSGIIYLIIVIIVAYFAISERRL